MCVCGLTGSGSDLVTVAKPLNTPTTYDLYIAIIVVIIIIDIILYGFANIKGKVFSSVFVFVFVFVLC